MNPEPKKNFSVSLADLPLHQLLELDVKSLSDEEIRDALKFIQEKKTSPQRRRSDANKQSKKLEGTDEVSQLLKDFM